jgi:hypothetical protein
MHHSRNKDSNCIQNKRRWSIYMRELLKINTYGSQKMIMIDQFRILYPQNLEL